METPRFKVGDRICFPNGIAGTIREVNTSRWSQPGYRIEYQPKVDGPFSTEWFFGDLIELEGEGWRRRRDANLRAVFQPEPSKRRGP